MSPEGGQERLVDGAPIVLSPEKKESPLPPPTAEEGGSFNAERPFETRFSFQRSSTADEQRLKRQAPGLWEPLGKIPAGRLSLTTVSAVSISRIACFDVNVKLSSFAHRFMAVFNRTNGFVPLFAGLTNVKKLDIGAKRISSLRLRSQRF